MTTESKPSDAHDVPNEVFQKFIQALASASAPAELVDRLEKTLLVDKKYTERALRDAVLPEELPR